MIFTHTDERRMLSETMSRYFAEKYPLNTRHESSASDTGYSPEQWKTAAELGFIGALFDLSVDGFGGAPFDLVVVFQELGKHLVVEPYLASAILGGTLLSELGSEEQLRHIANIIAGQTTLAFAHSEPDSRYDLSYISTTAQPNADGWLLNGQKAVVMNGDSADFLIVSARTTATADAWDEAGISLFLIPADTPGIDRLGYPSIDGLHAAEIRLSDVAVARSSLLGAVDSAFPVIEKAISRATLGLCAEALGLMEICRDLTIEYLATRQQFGVPIGTFQALQHRMATVLTEIEQARSSVINAAGRFDEERAVREKAVSAAKAMIGRIGRQVAEEAIQLHGGIAMTWEYSLGHYAKRLVMIDHQFGDVDYHTRRFSQLSKLAD